MPKTYISKSLIEVLNKSYSYFVILSSNELLHIYGNAAKILQLTCG